MTRGDAGRQRLFAAAEIPASVQQALASWQRVALASHGELRISRSLHVTLVFLGDVDSSLIPRIERALGAIRWRPARVRVTAPLFLPEHGRRRIVALELDDPDGALRSLQSRVAAALAGAGLHEPEKRPWLPHVTVARFRRPGHPFSLQNVNIPEFGVVRAVLYSSHLEQAGAVHAPVAVFPAS